MTVAGPAGNVSGVIEGPRVRLRPVRDGDWSLLERWGSHRDGLWGPYQRFQLDHVPQLKRAASERGLLGREFGLLLIETRSDERAVGFVRYTLSTFPDADCPCPDIGFGIAEPDARGQGLAAEATGLLVDYLFAGYPTERITAVTETANAPARRTLEKVGFTEEGTLRRAIFRDGEWRDLALYGLLRSERPT